MNTQRHSAPDAASADHLVINLSGPSTLIARLLAGMAGSLEDHPPNQGEPEPLFLSRVEAAKRSGLSMDRLSHLVKLGTLPNHGGPGRLLFSLAEIRAWQAEHR